MRHATAHIYEIASDDASLLVERVDVEVFRHLVVAHEVAAEMELRPLTRKLHAGIVVRRVRP